ncbi:MAG TPA: glycosyltransferase family 2 protein [Patescibacteria group bacterium]|nr:glycosyltransferase family 2 protein [Patescibacteria group bacterium]
MIKKPFLSIIIPAYKAEESIIPLLDSAFNSSFKDFEIIVVDDCSPDGTGEVVKGYGRGVRYHCLRKNAGPAKARNEGAKVARGEVLLFLDSDVQLYKNTLKEIANCFQKDPDLYAMTGVWNKVQRSKKFFPRFKALRDWSYWIQERDQRGYYFLFSTRIAAINRELFLRLGGFNEGYKGAMVEDIEFTYRIAQRYAVIFNPKMKVRHEFEDFWPIAKKYFFRARDWSKLYLSRRQFDPVATTKKEFITALSAVALPGFLFLGLFWHPFWLGTLIAFLVHLGGVYKFLFFVFKEEGLVFMFKALVVGWVLYFIIVAGGGIFALDLLKQKFTSFFLR